MLLHTAWDYMNQLATRAGTIQLSSYMICIAIYQSYYKELAGGEISVAIIFQVNLGDICVSSWGNTTENRYDTYHDTGINIKQSCMSSWAKYFSLV